MSKELNGVRQEWQLGDPIAGPAFNAARHRLGNAHAQASMEHTSIWECAVTCQRLRKDGLTDAMLLCLLQERLVEQRLNDFVLTGQGAIWASYPVPEEDFEPAGGLEDSPRVLPFYEAEFRQLIFDGFTIIEVPADDDDMDLVLRTLQEEHWPFCLDDPLPRLASQQQRARLSGVVDRLNEGQRGNLRLFFMVSTDVERIAWDIEN